MVDLRDYGLKEGEIYIVRVRAGPINSSVNYAVPFHSNMEDGDSLRELLQDRGLELVTLLSKEIGEHVKLTLMVEKEEI